MTNANDAFEEAAARESELRAIHDRRVTPARLPARNSTDKVLAGVCAGFADHFATDVRVVRLFAALAALFSAGVAVVAYLALWAAMPDQPAATSPVATRSRSNGSPMKVAIGLGATGIVAVGVAGSALFAGLAYERGLGMIHLSIGASIAALILLLGALATFVVSRRSSGV